MIQISEKSENLGEDEKGLEKGLELGDGEELSKKVPNLDGMICPAVGCGGKVIQNPIFISRYPMALWVCDSCGQTFSSVEEYISKYRKETEWAEAWLAASEKQP